MMTNPNSNNARLTTALPFLALEDLANMTEPEVRAHMAQTFEENRANIDRFEILVAYESVGSWGCDSSNWFLMRERHTGALYEAGGSHCSCYGFEGQFKPEPTHLEYLKSDKFSVSMGGYDSTRGDYSEPAGNEQTIINWIRLNL